MPFDSCWAKIARAKEHRDALDSYIRETFSVEANRPRFGAKFEPQTGEYVFHVNYIPDLAAFFTRAGIIFGDAAQNLRSALDHLAFALAIRHTKNNVRDPDKVQFPIADTPKKFENGKARWLREVGANDVAIIERFQGYNRFNDNIGIGAYFHPLSMLRDLSATDKHRLLTTVMIPPTGFETSLEALGVLVSVFGMLQGANFSLRHNPIELGTEIARAKLPAGLLKEDVKMAGYVAPHIAFPEGRPVLPVLDKLAAAVVTVVREFDPVT